MISLVPDLDDVTFEELVTEGRGLIPRYAPDWTDHNLHDPGITLIDLIAFLVDQQVYRIGFVGETLRTAFTRVLGVALREPEAARILVWPLPGAPAFDLEAGTPLETPDDPDARYTLDARIRMVAAPIRQIWRVTGPEEKALGTGLTEGRDALVLLPFSGGGPRALQFELAGRVPPFEGAGYLSLGISIAGAPEEAGRWDGVRIEQRAPGGYWRPLETIDRSRGLSRSEAILFRPKAETTDADAAQRFRIRLDEGFRPGIVTLERLALNVLPASEGWYDRAQPIGEGTGLPDQTIDIESDDLLGRDGTVFDTEAGGLEAIWPTREDAAAAGLGAVVSEGRRGLVVSTNSGGKLRDWEIRPDFSGSGPDDAHCLLTHDGIRFGNGLNGKVVPLGAQILRSAVRRTRGAAGGVAARLIWRIAEQDVGTNIAPSRGGRDRDRFADLAARARAVAKGREARLRSGEIETLLRGAGLGLDGVRVVPLRRPGLEETEAPGSRTVLILPIRDPRTPPGPASGALRDAVEAALEPARLMGERLHVSHPLYREVDVSVGLVIAADADPEQVMAGAEAILRQRLWDIRQTPDQQIEPWPAGRSITCGEIMGLMAGIREVVRVSHCRIAEPGHEPEETIPLEDREIALARSVEITPVRVVEGDER